MIRPFSPLSSFPRKKNVSGRDSFGVTFFFFYSFLHLGIPLGTIVFSMWFSWENKGRRNTGIGNGTTCSLTFQPSSNANTPCVYNRLVVPPRFQRFELPERKASKRFLASKWRDKERERESTSLVRERNFASERNATTIRKFRVCRYSQSSGILDSKDIASIDSFWPNCRVMYWIFCRGKCGREEISWKLEIRWREKSFRFRG